MSSREDVAFLVGSSSRLELLRTVVDEPYRPTELAETCDCARETAQRTLSEFVDRGWVVKSDSEYEATRAGELVLDGYDALATTVRTADRLGPFFANAGRLGEELPRSLLDGVTVTSASPDQPHAAIDRFLEVVGEEPVDSFYGISPIVSRVFNRAAERLIGPETEVELVIDEEVLSASESEYTEALQRAFELDGMQLYLSHRRLDSGLALVDDRAFLGAYDDDGNLVAGVDGDGPEFVSWVSETFERHRAAAEAVTPSDRPEATF